MENTKLHECPHCWEEMKYRPELDSYTGVPGDKKSYQEMSFFECTNCGYRCMVASTGILEFDIINANKQMEKDSHNW